MEFGNGVTVDYLELARTNPDLLLVAVAEIAEAAKAECITIPQFAGANAVGAAVAPESKTEPETEHNILDELSAEQKERAVATTTALAEKFGRDEADFSVVKSVNEAGEAVFAVALTATDKIDLGDPAKTYDSKRNWNKGIAKDDDPRFIIEVEGNKIDTRNSIDMKWLKVVAAANPKIREWVWRFGEKHLAVRGLAPIAYLRDGRADPGRDYRAGGHWDVGFRPVVVI